MFATLTARPLFRCSAGARFRQRGQPASHRQFDQRRFEHRHADRRSDGRRSNASTAATYPVVTISNGETAADLSAVVSDDGGSGNLSYAWNYVALSGGATTAVIEAGNEANSAVATFGSAGNYRITVTVTDTGSI